MNDGDSSNEYNKGGVSLTANAFQGISEIHCHFVGETVKTLAVSLWGDLLVPCSHSRRDECPASNKHGNPDRDLALQTGCPLGELWTAFEAVKREAGPE